MIRKILIHAYLQLIQDSKIPTLSLLTLFAHSLVFVSIILGYSYYFIEEGFNLNTSNQVLKYALDLLTFHNIEWKIAALAVFLFFGYFVFAPLGEGAIVRYVDSGHKSIKKAISLGGKSFFAITKYEAMTFGFNFGIFLRILGEVFINGANNGIVLSVMGIWFILILLVTCMFQYVKPILILEGIPIIEAIKKSFTLSFENLNLTLKLSAISLLFNMRLIINVLFIIGIPFAGIVLLQLVGLGGSMFADATIYLLFFTVLLFLAYIDTMVEGYFRIYRYLGYLKVSDNEEKLQKLGVIRPDHNGGLFDNAYHGDDMDLLKFAS